MLSVLYVGIVHSLFLNDPQSEAKTGEITSKPHNGMKICNIKLHSKKLLGEWFCAFKIKLLCYL